MVMPGTSGRELAERISARRQGIRVLFMSGYTDNVITSGGGCWKRAWHFFRNHFHRGALVQKVREVLSQTPAV